MSLKFQVSSLKQRLAFGLALAGVVTLADAADSALKPALTFYASFDHGTDADLAKGTTLWGIGRDTTEAEINRAIELFAEVTAKLRSMSPVQ